MNIKPTLNYANDTALDGLFTVKRANEWITASKVRPVPKMLFGECWLEGELALLTSPSGVGKSLLAVQIAESIARGRNEIEPFLITATAQPVLYFDLKLSDKQFEMRYAADGEPADEFLKKHYRFSDRFHRVEIDMTKRLPEGYGSWAEVLSILIQKLAAETKSKIVIIDDITSLQSSIYGYRETPPLMMELNRLKRQLGLSILVIFNDPGRDVARTPTSLRLLDRFTDSVFTIGQSKGDSHVRYIKQLRSRSTDMIYDASHVPSFSVGRSDDSFLGFELLRFNDEASINNVRDTPDWPVIERIKTLSDEGKSIRQIAEILEESKTKVHRWLQLWEPEEAQRQAAVAAAEEKAKRLYDFPGSDDFDRALEDPRFKILSDGDDETPDQDDLWDEYGDIEDARFEAEQAWKDTGIAPAFAEMVERMRKEREEENAAEKIAKDVKDNEEVSEAEAEPEPPDAALVPMRHRGRDILVEKFYENGKPHIWYDVNKSGQKIRVVQGLFGRVSARM